MGWGFFFKKNDFIFFYFLVLQLFPSSLVALRDKTEHWPKYLQVGQMQWMTLESVWGLTTLSLHPFVSGFSFQSLHTFFEVLGCTSNVNNEKCIMRTLPKELITLTDSELWTLQLLEALYGHRHTKQWRSEVKHSPQCMLIQSFKLWP